MKILFGIVGFVIFSISLPSASQSVDPAPRLNYFNSHLPRPSCPLPLTDDQKLRIVSSIESGHLIVGTVAGKSTMVPVKAQDQAMLVRELVARTNTFCASDEMKAAVQKVADEQANAALADYNRTQRENAARYGAAGLGAGSGYGAGRGSAGGSSQDTNQALVQAIGGVESAQKDYKKSKEEAGKASAKTAETATDKAAPKTDGTATAATGAGAVSGGTKPAAGAQTPAAAVAKPEALSALSDNNSMIGNGKVTLTDGSQYTFDPKTQTFKSPGNPDLSYENMATQSACTDPSCTQALAALKTDPEAAAAAQQVASGAGASATDAATQSQLAQIKAQTEQLRTQAQTAVQYAQGTKCSAYAANLNTAINAYTTAIESCSGKVSITDNLCSLVRSPKAILVQKLMSVGTVIINRQSSAADNCSSAQKFSRVAQAGMTAANIACSGMKYMCDASCATAETALKTMTTANTQLATCAGMLLSASKAAAAAQQYALAQQLGTQYGSVQSGVLSMKSLIAAQQPIPPQQIATCQKYEADIANMLMQILSLADANKAAKACKEALARNGGGGGGGGGTNTPDASMDEFCKIPGQAVNPPCLCRTQPSAFGCPGYVAAAPTPDPNSNSNSNNNANNNLNNGAGLQVSNTGGAANMATPGGLNGIQTAKKTNLSKEAREALGLASSNDGSVAAGADAGSATAGGVSGFGNDSSADLSAGGASGGAGSNGLVKRGTDAKKADAERGINFGRYEGIDGAFGFEGGGFGSGGKDAKGRKYTKEELALKAKQLAERKIASEEFFQQVTTASGKSNWDKVRNRYDDNRNTLFATP